MIHKNSPALLLRSCLLLALALSWAAESKAQAFASAINFGSVDVCPAGTSDLQCSRKITQTFTLSSFQLMSPQVVVLTDGMPNLDFTPASHVCAGISCTVTINFTPSSPGLKRGVVQTIDSNGAILSSAMLYGVGYGANLGFGISNQSVVASAPSAVILAVDAAGNVYYSQPTKQTITKITSSGATQMIASGFASKALAVDGAGTIFIGDITNERVLKLSRSGQLSVVATNILPVSLAVAGDGTLNISDDLGNQILQLSQTNQRTQLISGRFFGLAFDEKSNLYAQTTPSDVVEISQGSIGKILTMSSDIENADLAIDGAGSVFTTNSNSLQQLTPNGGIAVSDGYPAGVAIDKSSNIYYSDQYQGNIFKIIRTAPSKLWLLGIGSSRTQTIENTGNAALDDLQIATKGAVGANSSCPQTLSPGESCTFTMQATSSNATTGTVTISYSSNSRPAQVSAQVSVIDPKVPTGFVTTLYVNPIQTNGAWVTVGASFDTNAIYATGTMSYTANGRELCNLPVAVNTTSCRIPASLAKGITSYSVTYSGDGVFRSSRAVGQ